MNPADNISKFEVLPKIGVVDNDGVSVTTMTLKFDRAIQGKYGLNIELPLSRFESPYGSNNGLSDLNVRVRAQTTLGRWTVIGGLESVVPIATADSLGTGKLQLNPTIVFVYPLTRQIFAAVMTKQYLSVAGAADRADIRQGLYRTLLAYTSPKGWWVLADPQLYVDYAAAGRTDFQLEGEFGKMVAPLVGVWIRGGGHAAGPWTRNDWTLSAGIRFIRL